MNNRSNMARVAVVGGEGIGPEVTAQSHRIVNWFVAKRRAKKLTTAEMADAVLSALDKVAGKEKEHA